MQHYITADLATKEKNRASATSGARVWRPGRRLVGSFAERPKNANYCALHRLFRNVVYYVGRRLDGCYNAGAMAAAACRQLGSMAAAAVARRWPG